MDTAKINLMAAMPQPKVNDAKAAVKDTEQKADDFQKVMQDVANKDKPKPKEETKQTEKSKKEVITSEKADTSEKVETPNKDAIKADIMQLLMQMFAITPEQASDMCEQMMQGNSSEQVTAIMTLLPQDKLNQLMHMLQTSNTKSDEAVSIPQQQIGEFAEIAKDIITQPNQQTKVESSTQVIQQIKHDTVENSPEQKITKIDAEASFKAAVKEAKSNIESSTKPETKQTQEIDVDKLQQQAESFKLVAGMRMTTTKAASTELTLTEQELRDSILSQVKTGIVENLQSTKGNAKNEFVIKLKPEGLGEITVSLSQNAKGISLSILTQRAETQKLLSAEIANLKEALRPYNAHVDQLEQKADMSYSSFSQGSEQFARNGSWQSENGGSTHYSGNGGQPSDEDEASEQDTQNHQSSIMYA